MAIFDLSCREIIHTFGASENILQGGPLPVITCEKTGVTSLYLLEVFGEIAPVIYPFIFGHLHLRPSGFESLLRCRPFFVPESPPPQKKKDTFRCCWILFFQITTDIMFCRNLVGKPVNHLLRLEHLLFKLNSWS